MKKSIIFVILLSFIFYSCKNDKESVQDSSKTEEISSENIKNQLLNQNNSIETDTTEIKIVEADIKNSKDDNLIKETKEVKEAKIKLKEKKEKVIEKKVEASKYKKMDCEKMIVKYKSIIEEYKKTKNDELLLWKDTNDPIYKFCYEKYTTVFDSLERIENDISPDIY